jgi:hypothetical protein
LIDYKKYEERLIRNILKQHEAVRAIYGEAINEITFTAAKYTYKGKVFDLNKYPALKIKVDTALKQMHGSIYSVSVNGIKESWDLGNEKNNVLIDQRLKGRSVTPKAKQILYDPNTSALKSFTNRRRDGLGLSDRVWKGLKPFNNELEHGLALGIGKGQSAKEMARELQKHLKNPDELFRKVRNAKGELELSQRAKNFHPGRGVYRSSYQNALRLTASETNIAYRTSDHERWKVSPTVSAIEVKLSDAHPTRDICDHLVGKYPKDYKHVGFHTRCLCYAIPILTSDADFDRQLDAIFNDEEPGNPMSVKKVPGNATKWMKANAEKLQGYKSLPYFIRDNPQYYGKYFD